MGRKRCQEPLIHDRETGITERVSGTVSGTIDYVSADGRVVAFDSGAGDLVGDDTNNVPDVFVYAR